jgi:hypothetical protein
MLVHDEMGNLTTLCRSELEIASRLVASCVSGELVWGVDPTPFAFGLWLARLSPRAEGSTPLAQWRAQGRWPASYDQLWEALKQRQGKQEGTRAMIEVLQLGSKHGYLQLQEAVEKGLGDGVL